MRSNAPRHKTLAGMLCGRTGLAVGIRRLAVARAAVRWASAERVIPVYYGSQTGTAKAFSKMLSREGRRNDTLKGLGVKMKPISLSDASPAAVADQDIAVFVTASYGEGEPTDNAKGFYKELQDEDVSLASSKVALFGLGCQKTYPHRYQAFPRNLEKTLNEKGASWLLERGEGDDGGDIEKDFLVWRQQFWPALEAAVAEGGAGAGAEKADAAAEGEQEAEAPAPPLLLGHQDDIAHMPSTHARMAGAHPLGDLEKSAEEDGEGPRFLSARVVANEELYGEASPRSCRLVSLHLPPGEGVGYEAGDHVGVLPSSSPRLVQRFARALMGDRGLDHLDYVLSSAAECTDEVAVGCTLRDALAGHFDINGAVSREALLACADAARDGGERDRLRHMASLEGAAEFEAYVTARRLTMTHVLEAHPSVEMDLASALELLPRVGPRFYSVSSSPTLMGRDNVDLTVSVVREPGAGPGGDETFAGLCTGFLGSLSAASVRAVVPAFVRRSTFRLPEDPNRPVIFVGAGSGIAPFRGFLQQLDVARQSGRSTPRTTLVFGCRHEASEFPYADELAHYRDAGVLSSLVTAFSHDGALDEHGHPVDPAFVQHRILERGEDMWRQLEQERGTLLVCGDATTLAAGVREAVETLARDKGGMSADAAARWVADAVEDGRYREDVFTNVPS